MADPDLEYGSGVNGSQVLTEINQIIRRVDLLSEYRKRVEENTSRALSAAKSLRGKQTALRATASGLNVSPEGKVYRRNNASGHRCPVH